MNRIYAVIDCNNFFVSCERMFRPELEHRPVVVLSNNDGCAVSRSNEAKPLIPMGAPLFKHESALKQAGAIWLSANFHLYGDMSRRVMELLSAASPEVEQYSVDEAFLQIGHLGIDDYRQWGLELRYKILRWTGLPVSIGIGETKTLAKAAVERAKKHQASGNVFDFTGQEVRDQQLAQLPIGDVWGVGRRLAPKLKAYGLRTAADLRQFSPAQMRQLYSSQGTRTIQELNGVDCFGSEVTFNQPAQRNITASRSFGQSLRAVSALEPAIASFIVRAAAKARVNDRLATTLDLYLVSGSGQRRQTFRGSVRLPEPTNDTSLLLAPAIELLGEVHAAGRSYKKAGINLGNLVPLHAAQQRLDNPSDPEPVKRRQQLMRTVDGLNQQWGKGTVDFAVTRSSNTWHSRRQRKSPAYTTNWNHLPVATT